MVWYAKEQVSEQLENVVLSLWWNHACSCVRS